MNILTEHDFNITTIDTGFVAARFAASYLITENNHAVYIETGANSSLPNLLKALEYHNIPVENVDYVIVTHVHLDHAGGAGQIMQHLPNASFVVHPYGARHMIDPSKLVAGSKAVYGDEAFQASYGDIVPIPEERVIKAADEHVINFQGRQLLFLDTPGHARHHFCIFDERSKSFFTGDTFGISFRDFDTDKGVLIFASTTPIQFDPPAMHNSIDRLLQYKPEKMFLTHYDAVTNVSMLAEKLHISIDKQVDIMKSVANSDRRHTLLRKELMNHLVAELQTLGYTLNDNEIRRKLADEVEINAQGLEIWWDK
ncbi:MBL fold metallo-hydrolase [Candidatus Halobeggiatoa sp. HSG11]|nr:MBL fold metallo-hydrolase [Candidatus Halobeggiatoa sp. HSG11]